MSHCSAYTEAQTGREQYGYKKCVCLRIRDRQPLSRGLVPCVAVYCASKMARSCSLEHNVSKRLHTKENSTYIFKPVSRQRKWPRICLLRCECRRKTTVFRPLCPLSSSTINAMEVCTIQFSRFSAARVPSVGTRNCYCCDWSRSSRHLFVLLSAVLSRISSTSFITHSFFFFRLLS